MDNKYIIGVDGGGTKTDYLIFTTQGEWVDSIRVGSRSHEFLGGGFAETEELLLSDLDNICKKNSISKESIEGAAFGLAGIDTPKQLASIKKILDKAELKNYVVTNDSVLGIKAGCPSGVGVCSINGTGTVASGINEKGEILQVGGIGFATGDSGGGHYFASLAVRAVYDYYFRCGSKTVLADLVMNYFKIEDPKELPNVISDVFYADRSTDKDLVTLLFQAAVANDEVAIDIVKDVADQLAKSVSGCINGLKFQGIPEVILAGSVWTKGNCPPLLKHFREKVNLYTGKNINPLKLKVIPAAGAVLWAMELVQKHPATLEQRSIIINHKALQNL